MALIRNIKKWEPLAPISLVGGLLLKNGGGNLLYSVMFFACLVIIVLYHFSAKLSQKKFLLPD